MPSLPSMRDRSGGSNPLPSSTALVARRRGACYAPPMLEPYLRKWDLTPAGEPIVTHTSQLLPVLSQGQPAMLKVTDAEDERHGHLLLRWWAGEGAARVLAFDDG